MKAMISIFTMFISVAAAAQNHVDVVFGNESLLPRDLQVRILKVISEKCVMYSPNGVLTLKERNTEVAFKYVDQIPGDMDFYYKTTFDSYYEVDSAPPVNNDIIIVNSEKFSVSHPAIDPLIVNSVVSVGDTCSAIAQK